MELLNTYARHTNDRTALIWLLRNGTIRIYVYVYIYLFSSYTAEHNAVVEYLLYPRKRPKYFA